MIYIPLREAKSATRGIYTLNNADIISYISNAIPGLPIPNMPPYSTYHFFPQLYPQISSAALQNISLTL